MASLAAPAIPIAPLLRARFIATVFAGSFLLFLVQPMIARMALPRLGGAPAVWNSAMLVYQALLLAGYAYAHWLGRLAPRRQAFVHLTLFGLAALTLPLSLIGATPGPGANIFVWVPWLLLVSIGPLFLVVSAQAPLIQRWFALAGGGDPYPLYAASNFGNFLGLVCYPLIVEPLLPVAAQSQMWSIGYGLLALFVIGCALLLPRSGAAPVETTSAPRPTRREIAKWIGLAFIPSGLMLSTTLHLTTDIVAMPLLWVVPLGLYLLSYSVAFAANRTPARWITRAAPVILLLVALSVGPVSPPFPFLIALVAVTGLFAVSVALHAMLFDRRPDPSQLTLFYLATSVGGVLGGLFCALVAPLSFDWTYEHPLLLIAAAAVIGGTPLTQRLAARWARRDERTRRLTRWLGVAALLLSLAGNGLFASDSQLVIVGAIAIGVLALVAIGNRPLFAMALAALMLSLGGWDKLALSVSDKMTRSFFGIYMVGELAGARLLVHGTTTHGVQNLGSPARERMATSYYAPRSGVGLAMAAVPGLFPAARVDIVGLGAGTLGCYGVPDQTWRFFEIDPKVETIARSRFSFLSRCQPTAPVVIGDARLTIDRTPAASADVLVIDAFSSDSVPMHLLTLQAFEVYRRHLRPDGLLMVHISNRYLDLAPVIAAAAAAHGWSSAARSYYPTPAEERGRATASQWIALSRSPATVSAVVRASRGERWTRLEPTTLRAWTDDHASILPVIRWKS